MCLAPRSLGRRAGVLVSDALATLREAAFAALQQAYAPYSRFRVGAALAAQGQLFIGCNVESAAYGSTLCAERGAVMQAVVHGVQRFDHLVIATEGDHPVSPCGACRQLLAEFAPHLRITSVTRAGGAASWTLDELLPHPFGAKDLDTRP